MAKLIVKDRRLCIVNGRLVSDGDGAPCVCGDGPGPNQPFVCDYPECVRVNLSGISVIDFEQCFKMYRGAGPLECRFPGGVQYFELIDHLVIDRPLVFTGYDGNFELERVTPSGSAIAQYTGFFPGLMWHHLLGRRCETCQSPNGSLEELNNLGFLSYASNGIRIDVSLFCRDLGGPGGEVIEVEILVSSTASEGLVNSIEDFNFPDNTATGDLFRNSAFVPRGIGRIDFVNTLPLPEVISVDPNPFEISYQITSVVGGGQASITVPGRCGEFPARYYTKAVLCSDTSQFIVVDPATNINGGPGIRYQEQEYRLTNERLPDNPVPVEWTDRVCLGSPYTIAVNCNNPNDRISIVLGTRPSPQHITVIYNGNRYVVSTENTSDEPVEVEWSTDPCPGSDRFAIATKCRPFAQGPDTVVYAVNPAVGAGNGAVRLVVTYPNPACPDRTCTAIIQYQPTTQITDGPATPGTAHLNGTACGLPEQITCQSCDGPVGPGRSTGDEILDAMGFDPEEELRRIRSGGCCGQPGA
jgi:hypothetical protein